jgi:hypothetical protein
MRDEQDVMKTLRGLIWGGHQRGGMKTEQTGYARESTLHRRSISVAASRLFSAPRPQIDVPSLPGLTAGHMHPDRAHI